jgi:AraC family transcriptional regulator, positive regulator of tynA and feaB
MAALELFIAALRSDSDVCSAQIVRPALRASIERYIDRHLLTGAVTPAALAAAHWVSIRTVNRVFSATGQTVGEVVRVRRPARARADVTESDQPISNIAQRWGFSDTTHFSRTSKAHYGCSPTDYRNAYPLRRLGLLTHRFSGLSRRFKPQTHRARSVASQRVKGATATDCGGS